MTLTIGSLFSGIGLLELGLEWAGLGPVLWQVERSEYCRAVLERHWPGVERHDDIRAVGAGLAPVDLICGGFPCQDVSSAGARAGLAGSRSGLWSEFARVVGQRRPRWVVVENVASGAGLWLDEVVRELDQLGYEALPVPLSAEDVGADHRRSRVFVIAADTHCEGQPAVPVDAEVGGASTARDLDGVAGQPRSDREGRAHPPGPAWRPPVPDVRGVADGRSRRLDSPRRRIAALGNAVVPQCAEVIGWIVRELDQDLQR